MDDIFSLSQRIVDEITPQEKVVKSALAFQRVNELIQKISEILETIVKLDFQYAHRFMNYPGEASYLHGHSGLLTIEIEGELDKYNYAYPVKEAQKLAWAVADNFIHATIFQEGDPLLDLVLQGYEQTGMKGTTDRFGTPAKVLNHELVKSYPESRVAVSKGPSTCEWFCTVFYELLKDKLNIKKIEFRSSSLNCASKEF